MGGNKVAEMELNRVASNSTFHVPGASSFYGKANSSNTQVNISHLRNNTDGEVLSSNY